jgi:16S rRNA (guanine1207-N2)-methyltransferase
MSHYYKFDEQLQSKPFDIQFEFDGLTYTFLSDIGVFSKSNVDYGTRVMLESIHLNSVSHILDMGCGYGVSGIVLKSKFKDAHLSAFDINPRAVELTKKNLSRYHINSSTVYVSDGIPNEVDNVDLAVLNPPIRAGKDTVFKLYQQAYEVLVKGGSLIVVIQKKQGANSTLKYLESTFHKVNVLTKDKGYHVYQAIKN